MRVAILVAAMTLGGCVQTSDLYATRQWQAPAFNQPDDRPRVNLDQLEPKASFVHFVDDECSPDHIGDTSKEAHEFRGWALKNRVAAVCVQHIAAYAMDQCTMITRRQNVVAADANLALGAVTLGSGLTAVAYAIKGSTNDRLAATSLAGAASASNTSRGFLPVTTSVKIADLLTNALLYAEYVGLDDKDISSALKYPVEDRSAPSAKGSATANPNARGGDEMVTLARVHDAVFAACGANAYGPVPSRKPFK